MRLHQWLGPSSSLAHFDHLLTAGCANLTTTQVQAGQVSPHLLKQQPEDPESLLTFTIQRQAAKCVESTG